MQTNFVEELEPRYEGQIMESGASSHTIARATKEAIRFGLLVVNLPSDEEYTCRIIPAGAAADADSIMTAAVFIAGAAPVVLLAAVFDGVIGDGEISPARNLTIAFANDADWNATTIVVEGLDENGLEISEDFLVPDNGNATVTGLRKFSRVLRVTIPAQAAAATATMGTGVDYSAMQGVLGVAARDEKLELGAGYAAEVMATIVTKGMVAVHTETACEIGDEVYVRIVTGGAEVRGQFRADIDGTIDAPDAIRVPGMRFARRRTTAGLVWAELNLGGL